MIEFLEKYQEIQCLLTQFINLFGWQTIFFPTSLRRKSGGALLVKFHIQSYKRRSFLFVHSKSPCLTTTV